MMFGSSVGASFGLLKHVVKFIVHKSVSINSSCVLTVDLYHIILYRNTSGMSHLKVKLSFFTYIFKVLMTALPKAETRSQQ
jgi:hypothetical protein